MLKLDEETQNAVMRGNLSLEQAEPLLDAPKSNRVEVAGIIAERNLSASRRDGWFPNRKTARSMAKDAPCAGDGRGAAPLRWVERAGAACKP